MAITVKHTKVSAVPDGADTSVVRPSDWNADHTLTGLGTAAALDAGVPNGVATLDSDGKVPVSQIPQLGDLNYQGTWNASTNTPTLVSSTGTKGYYYVVNVAGTTNLNGITDWQIGDWAVFNGTAWQKIDNTDLVTSVNGYTGAVVLTAADVSAVPYTGATTAIDLNTKTLTNVSRLGINSTVVPDILVRAYGDNNSSSRISIRGYSSDANSSSMRVAKFRGTAGAPQAPQNNDSLGKFELAGYGTTSSTGYPQVSVEGVATENWGATARGAKAVVKVTPNTTITQVTALTINQDSTAVFANTVTANGVLLTGNTGTVNSVAASVPSFLSISGSPITTSGTLAITYSGTALPVVNGGTGVTTSTGTGSVVLGTRPTISVTGAGLTLQDATDNTKQANFDLSGLTTATTYSYSLPAVSGSALATLGNITQSFSGSVLFSNNFNINGNGNVTIGPTTGTATLIFGQSTVSQTTNIQAGATASGSTKTINIGTGGLASSTTAINIGPTLGSGIVSFPSATAFSNTVQFNNGATSITATSLVGGSFTVGGTSQTGTNTFGQSTVTGITNIASGATASGSTKTLNLGTGGLAGSTTSIAIGSANGTTVNLNGILQLAGAPGTSGQVLTSSATGTPTWSTPAGSNITAQGLYENASVIAANYTIGTGNNAVSAGPITVASGATVTIPSGSVWVIV